MSTAPMSLLPPLAHLSHAFSQIHDFFQLLLLHVHIYVHIIHEFI